MNYAENYTKDFPFIYCEICRRSDQPCDVHHIVYRSRMPKHPEIDNVRNLILVCRSCHNKIHGGVIKVDDLIEERGLKELFDL